MAIPKAPRFMFDLEIPTTKQKIKITQMKASDQKLLLMAKADPKGEDIFKAIKQCLNNCIVTPNIDIDQLAIVDVEYMFIKLRAASISKIINVTYTDPEDQQDYEHSVNLDDVIVKFPETEKVISVGEGMKIHMIYPKAYLYTDQDFIQSSGKDVVDTLIASCIEKIVDNGTEYKDSTIEEKVTFINDLPILEYDKLRKYLNELPTVYYQFSYTNKNGKERKIAMNTLNDFFTF